MLAADSAFLAATATLRAAAAAYLTDSLVASSNLVDDVWTKFCAPSYLASVEPIKAIAAINEINFIYFYKLILFIYYQK